MDEPRSEHPPKMLERSSRRKYYPCRPARAEAGSAEVRRCEGGMNHIEVRYWEGAVRRCDIYQAGSKQAVKKYESLTKSGICAHLVDVCSSHDILKDYREMKEAQIMGAE